MRWAARLYRQAIRTPRPQARRRPARLRVESLEAREVPHVTGTAFLDLNLNGAQDAEDVGVAGVTVKATDQTGVTETVITGTDGGYTLLTDADDLRIEFSTLPEVTFAGRVVGGSGPLVRFLNASADRSAVDLALASPRLVTTQFFFDDALNGANAASGAVLAVPYGADSSVTPTVLASVSDVGSVWGLVYNPTANALYTSSFLKRHAGFGPAADGTSTTTGGIYRIDPTGSTPPALLIDLNAAGTGLGTGADPHPTQPDPDGDWFHDAAALPLVGKRGLGGLALSQDGRTLYTVNLNTRQLLEIPLRADGTWDTGATIRRTTIPLTAPAGSNIGTFNADDLRPFAVTVRNGAVFVGVTYTAETTGIGADLRAVVYAFDPVQGAFRTFNQASGTFAAGAAPVLVANLTYARGAADDPTPDAVNSGDEVRANWRTWVNDFPTQTGQEGFPVHPSPWLTDIAFDGANMVLGVRDRFGDQGGFQTGSIAAGSEEQFAAIAVGDILRAAPSGTGWALESNGAAGGVSSAGAGNGQGPGGGEYYYQDTAAESVPQEVATGGLAQVPGFRTIAATGNDPVAAFGGGLYTFFNADRDDSTRTAGQVFTKTALYESSDLSTFGSANGLGDVAAMAAAGTVQVGDRVFQDTNANGLQDAGEPGISGVVLRLFQGTTEVDTATTGDAGDFLFDDLQPGTAYQVRIDTTQSTLTNRTVALANQGTNDQLDSDATLSGTTATVAFTTGDAGTSDHALDVGFSAVGATPAPTLTLGDTVFRDLNNNGTQDAADTGITGVTVELLDAAGSNVLRTTTTGTGGAYTFAGLNTGTYRVGLAPSNFNTGGVLFGFTPSGTVAEDPDNNVDKDSNGSASGTLGSGGFVVTGPITITPNGEPEGDGDTDRNTNRTLDFGLVSTTSLTLGNLVFNDANGNGLFDTLETGISGVAVDLVGPTGTVLQSTTTAAGGVYRFAGLAAGDYKVRLAATNFNTGGPLVNFLSFANSPADPDDNANNGDDGMPVGILGSAGFIESGVITLTANGETGTDGDSDNNTNLSVDFGMVARGANTLTLGDRVATDTDNDGTLDDRPAAGLAGVTVQLLNAAGTVLQTALTDATGLYSFAGLAGGSYKVRLAASNFQAGGPLVGHTPSGIKAASPNTNEDNNNDGGAVGTLGSATGFVESSAVTLAAGTEPTDDGDSDNNTNRSLDFGLVPPSTGTLTIGNLVFNDANNNGLKDAAETGVGGVTVQLLTTAGAVLQTTTTAADGTYSFTNLGAGNFKLRLPSSNFTGTGPLLGFTSSTGTNGSLTGPFEGAATPGPNSATDNDDNATNTGLLGTASGSVETSTVTLAGSTSNTNVDFGLFRKLSLGNSVFNDQNNNGTQDTTEPGILNVAVRLLNADASFALVATTTTNAQGQYLFTNLQPGNYTVDLADTNFRAGGVLFGFQSSGGLNGAFEPAPAGATDKQDHGTATGPLGSGGSVQSRTIAVSATGPTGEDPNTDPNTPDAQTNLTVDFGLFQQTPSTASIAGRVFLDFNNSGGMNGPDSGISGATVSLSGGGLSAPIAVQTDAVGNFTFNNLQAGTYTLTQTQPTTPTNQSGKVVAGTAGGTAAAATNTISGITLTANQAATGYNFAEVPLVSTGGTVYEDVNGNGTKDGNEPGIVGVTLTLTGTSIVNGAIAARTATTGADGAYTFPGLTPGTYAIAETQPAAYTDGKESNGTPAAATVTNDRFGGINLTTAVAGTGFNFGEVKGASLAGAVFDDVNNDGVKAATGEVGISGVKVRLLGTDDLGRAVNKSATTGADGTYLFGSLRPGTYRVAQTQPARYADGKEAAGTASGSTTTNDQVTGIQLTSGTAATGYLFAEQARADLVLTMTPGTATINPGGTVTITYTLRNRGTATATGAGATINFNGLTFVSASTPAEFNATTRAWAAGDLEVGASKTIRLVMRGSAVGSFTPTARATATSELSTTNNGASSTIAVGVAPQERPSPLGFLSRLWFLSSSTNARRR